MNHSIRLAIMVMALGLSACDRPAKTEVTPSDSPSTVDQGNKEYPNQSGTTGDTKVNPGNSSTPGSTTEPGTTGQPPNR